MTKTFIDVLEELEKTTGTNDKIEILKANKDNFQLKESLRLVLDKNVTFGIAEFTVDYGSGDKISDTSAFNMLQALSQGLCDRKVTGQAALDAIGRLFAPLTQLQSKWIEKILKKDLACIGIGQTLYEQAYDEKGFKFRLMLAEQESELDKVPDEEGALDKKANGVRTVIKVEEWKVIAIYGGRNGLIADNFYFIKEEIEKLVAGNDQLRNVVFDGEVHVNDCLEDTMSLYGFKYRNQSDFIGKTGKLKEKAWADYQADETRINKFKADAKFTIFDAMPLYNWENQTYSRTLKDRKSDLNRINSIIKDLGIQKIEIIPSVWVKNKEEAVIEAQKWIANGFEGGVFKVGSGIYEWKRSRNWVKIKEVCDFEVEFAHYEIQKAKHNPDGTLKPAMVGAIFGVDRDGNEYKIGTGKALDENTRIDMLNNWQNYDGKIGTCSAQRPSGKGKYICPRLDIIRLDRNELD